MWRHFHQQCFQNRFGPFKKWKLLFGDYKVVKVGMKLGWQQNCWSMFPTNFWMHYYDYTLMCYTLGNRLLHGGKISLQCYRKNWEQNKLLISDLSPTYGCYTKCLLTSSLDDWNMYLMHSNLKNNMVARRRLEGHLLSTNILLDKAQAIGVPVWISNWISSLDYQFGLIQGVWPGTLACTVGSPLWARNLCTFDLDFTTGVLWTTWWNYW